MNSFDKMGVEIAGILITLETSISGLFTQIKSKYNYYECGRSRGFNLSIRKTTRTLSGSRGYPDLTYEQGLLIFHAGTCYGVINLEQRQANLELTDTRQLEDLDYFLRVLLALLCFQAGGLLIHGAGIVKNSKAYIFFGHSGSGKTTVSKLTSQGYVLSDDLVVIKPNQHSWRVFATPFGRITALNPSADGYHLSALFRLVQDKQTYIERVPKSSAIADLLASTPIVSSTPTYTAGALNRCEQLTQTIPIYRLHFLPDDSFWTLIDG